MSEITNDSVPKMKFKDLPTNEQLKKLETMKDAISPKVMNDHSTEIVSGELEIVDYSYIENDNGDVAIEVLMKDKDGNDIKEYYGQDLEKIDFSKTDMEKADLQNKISIYSTMNADTTELDAQLAEMEKNDIRNSKDKTSLLETQNIQKDIEERAASMGMDKDDIEMAMTFNASQELKLDPSKINGTNFGSVQGNASVSKNYNINDVLGEQYVSYQIIKTRNGAPMLLGIDKDGLATEVKNVELDNSSKNISLMRANGDNTQATMSFAFRVKSSSDVNRDQLIGVCVGNGQSNPDIFYGRGAITSDKIIAEDIPYSRYTKDRETQERIMDTKNNKDIDPESETLEAATSSNGDIADTQNVVISSANTTVDLEEYVAQVAEEKQLDPSELYDNSIDALNQAKNEDIDIASIVESEASELEEENEKDDNGGHDHGDGAPDDREDRGTPPTPFPPLF